MRNQFILCGFLAFWALLIPAAHSQGSTAFTYQGQLKDNGTNANGSYTMIFKLYDAASAGNQVGGTITTPATLANGLFTVNLDYGAGVFNGAARWLDITITNGGVTQTLSPRVQVLAAPYAQFATLAATVTNGAIGSAQLAANSIQASNIVNGAIGSAQLATNSIQSSNIVNGAVGTAQLATNSILATNIAAGQIVKSFNGLTDNVNISAGDRIWLATNANTIQINYKTNAPSYWLAGNNLGFIDVGTNGDTVISSLVPHVQVFQNVTNATFVVPTNVLRIMVEMWGGGGGGGAGATNYQNVSIGSVGSGVGGGGGAGAYAWNFFSVTPGTNYLVTAGSGGSGGILGGNNGGNGSASSFGPLISAGGGLGGQNGINAMGIYTTNGVGGLGASVITGSLVNYSGGSGDSAGNGGGVWRGGPATPLGTVSYGPGSGGSGGMAGIIFPPTPYPPSPGKAGSAGLVIVYY